MNNSNYWQQIIDNHEKISNISFSQLYLLSINNTVKTFSWSLSSKLTQQLHQFCNRHNFHPNNFLLSVLYTLLLRYTHQKQLVISNNFFESTFPSKKIEEATYNSVKPTAIKWCTNWTIIDLLKEISFHLQQDTKQYSNWKNFKTKNKHIKPDWLQVVMTSSEKNLKFDKIFTFNLDITDLHFHFNFKNGAFSGRSVVSYSLTLFNDDSIKRFLTHFEALLQQFLDNPHRLVKDLPVMTTAERQQLVMDWNQTAKSYPKEATIASLFEAQVEKTPDAIALIFEDEQLTYAQLNARANQLAHYLQQEGVGPDDLVALCLERSINMVVSLLAVLKAGGAYVPLDPSYPVERIQYMVGDCLPKLVLGASTTQALLTDVAVRFIALDALSAHLSTHYPKTNPVSDVQARNLAYVIYTSGSTGKPKGVMIEHQSLVNLVIAYKELLNYQVTDSWLALTTLSFDIAGLELYTPLTTGAKLVLANKNSQHDPALLVDLITQHQIKVLQATPSTWTLLSEQTQALNNLKALIGGEALTSKLAAALLTRVGSLYNCYGPTETTIWSLFYVVNAKDITIGRPIANTQCYILDAHLNPVPIGVTGELYIGGAGLARGYLNRPELTAERFIPNPFMTKEDEAAGYTRLYKTGDLCRYRADGNIEYLGRIDHQVKIRGFRIELGEIEATLMKIEGIRDAVVLAHEQDSHKQLVAYYVTSEPRDVHEIRTTLKETLPEYMIPSFFIALDALPLTPNGKLDRNALPAPEGAAMQHDYVAPTTEVEAILVAIWQTVLHVPKIGIFDNFFELGGDSLRAVSLVSRIRKQLACACAVAELFKYPTISGLAAALTPVMHTQKHHALMVPERPTRLPLSFAQQRMWFLAQLDSQSGFYNIPALFRMQGPFNQTAFTQALSTLMHHHEMLRISMQQDEQGAYQVVHAQLALPLNMIDASSLSQKAYEDLLTADSFTPFDLSKAPLWCATLIKRHETEWGLSLVFHHSITDGWSMNLIIQALNTFYAAALAQEEIQIPSSSMDYIDFALWQRHYLADGSSVLAEQLAYWQKHVANAPWFLALPTDYSRPAEQDFHGASIDFLFSAEFSAKIIHFSEAQGVTPYMTLLAAFYILLARISNQNELIIGSPIAGRHYEEFEGIIGLFVNTLALAFHGADKLTFIELLVQVKQTTLLAQVHQDLPFERLVDSLKLARDLAYSPLVQVMFNWNPAQEQTLAFKEVTLSNQVLNNPVAKFDFTLDIGLERGIIRGAFEYATALFSAESIQRLANQFELLLQQLIAQPNALVASHPLTTARERQQLVMDWNQTAKSYPKEATIASLFEAQVEKTPDAIALIFEDEQLTYAQLNARANQLAHYLQQEGVGPDDLVALCLERSINMVVSLLAVLKAGGAYVPLDPSYPVERIQYMVGDCLPKLVLGASTTQALLTDVAVRFIALDALSAHLSTHYPKTNPVSDVQARNLAYVIYTSGSTGKPKGVMIEHQNTVSFLVWSLQIYSPDDLQCVLASTSICFDLSVFEFFAPLCSGGSVLLVPNILLMNNNSNTKLVSLINTVPSAIAALISDNQIYSMFPNVRVINLAGEALKLHLINEIYIKISDVRLYNLYGPSEDTTYSTFELQKQNLIYVPTIGRPIANTQCYILDAYLNPVPIGVTGELYIGGAGLARGYLNRPELTAERFIPNPFMTKEDEAAGYTRLYKTGDLCRYRADGNIEYLGRIDHQVKIRGFRIELGEIEATLMKIEGIRDAVVLAHEQDSHKQLVAYYVTSEPRDVHEIRTTLKETLPEYMIPSFFIALDALPLTPNGKLDRNALPAPEGAAMQHDYVAPTTEVEAILVTIWQTVLHVPKIGIFDNFFELGGDSLRAVSLVSRIRKQLACACAVAELFKYPTISGLAAALTPVMHTQKHHALMVPERPTRLPLSFAQQRMWFLAQLDSQSGFYNIPALFRMQGPFNQTAFTQALSTLMHHHEMLRISMQQDEQGAYQVVHAQLALPLNIIDASSLSQKAYEDLLTADSFTPFDLSKAPLWRATLIKRHETEWGLSLVFHHSITDGWSMNLIIQALNTFYAAALAQEEIQIPSSSMDYIDFALWQRHYLADGSSVLAEQLAYWQKHVANAPWFLALPTDYSRPAEQDFHGASIDFLFSAEFSAKIIHFSEAQGVTPYMTLLAAFYILLARISNQNELIIGSPIAGRHYEEFEGIIGLFVNTLALAFHGADKLTFIELLVQVKQTTLLAQVHQDLPFERLVDSLKLARDLAYSPLVQVMFNWNPAQEQTLAFKEVTLSNQVLNNPVAKFDFTLDIGLERGIIRGAFEYATALFSAESIQRLANQFELLLQQLIAQPNALVASHPLTTARERQQLVMNWNQTAKSYPKDATIASLFEAQVEKTPDAIALIFEDEQLTYAQLNARANQLAHYLQQEGVGPDDLVALCLERSINMVVSLLAVLKAGGAYVPLDPSYPVERIQYMVGDCLPKLVLGASTTQALLTDVAVRFIALDALSAHLSTHYPKTNPVSDVQARNLAYVIYTSGSTGKPKGVMIEHQSVANYLLSLNELIQVTSNDTLLQQASFSFDVSVEEFFIALLNGARLVLAQSEQSHDLSYLSTVIKKNNITILDIVPNLMDVLVHDTKIGDNNYSSIRTIILGGSALSTRLGQKIHQLYSNVALLNLYGPTETTISSTHYLYANSDKSSIIPIGKPLNNTQCFILDAHLNPVPIGVTGELYIGGAGLARGYLNRPELTAERFIPNPFMTKEDEAAGYTRLYKTGDLCRYRADGNIEYLGRIDHQVKIRGFRIELGEIEATLMKIEGIRDAVVLAHEQDSHKQLVAYYVTSEPRDVHEIRTTLKETLPEYMIPSFFIALDALPPHPEWQIRP